ncbi:MAG: hypothetical protein LR015_00420 [Verrucomicrobia bacterium]|nr:hypothetical protein [Verrucomicrobiota bacterium]
MTAPLMCCFLEGAQGNRRLLFINPMDARQFPRAPVWIDPFWVDGALNFPNERSVSAWLPAQRTNRMLSSSGRTIYSIQTGSDVLNITLTAPTYTVKGRTTDGLRPISGVEVRMELPHSRTTITDSEGYFTFSNVSFADTRLLEIFFSKDGYSFPSLFDWGDRWSPGHVERIQSSAEPVVFEIVAPSAALRGSVSMGSLNASDFRVQLINSDEPDTVIESTIPDIDGSYQFTRLQRGSYTIRLIDPNGLQQQYSLQIPLVTHTDTIVQVPQFQILYPLSGFIQSRGELHPLPATLKFRRLDPPPGTTIPDAFTMGTGSYQIHLQPGTYEVELWDPSDHLNIPVAARRRTVELLGPVSDVNFTLPTGALSGRITTRPGIVIEPYDFSGSVVDLYLIKPRPWTGISQLVFIARGETDAAGNYYFKDLVPGPYMVVLPGTSSTSIRPFLSAAECNPAPNNFFPARPNPINNDWFWADNITILDFDPYAQSAFQIRPRTDVALSEVHGVRSNLTTLEANTMAELYPHSFRVMLRTPDGETALAAENTVISYIVPDDRLTMRWQPFYQTLHGTRTATINADAATTVWMHSTAVPSVKGSFSPQPGNEVQDPLQPVLPVLQLSPVTISGRITTLQSNIGVANIPVAGMWFGATPQTNVHGEFTGQIWPLVAPIEPQSNLIEFEPLRRTVRPPFPGEQYIFRSINPEVGGTITINGTPAAGIRVWNSLGQSIDTDEFGRFFYDFLSAEQETFTIDPRSGTAHPAELVVDLTQGAVRGLQFELMTGHLQLGPVVNSVTGQPMSGIRIAYRRLAELNPQRSGVVTLDEDGSFLLSNLPTGTYQLNVLLDNGTTLFPIEQSATVLPNETTTVSWESHFPRYADSAGFLFVDNPDMGRTREGYPIARMDIPLDTSMPITLEAWIAPQPNLRSGTLPILSWFDREPGTHSLFNNGITWMLDRHGHPTLVVDVSHGTDVQLRHFHKSPQAIPFNGNWTHLAVILEPVTPTFLMQGTRAQSLTFYINGHAVHRLPAITVPSANNIQHAVLGWTKDTFILYPEILGPHQFFGAIDDLRVWQRAFTQEELQAHIITPLTADALGLVASYRFDLPAQPLFDESPAARHGTPWYAEFMQYRNTFSTTVYQGNGVTLFPQIQTLGMWAPSVSVTDSTPPNEAWPTSGRGIRVQSNTEFTGVMEVDLEARVGEWQMPEHSVTVNVLRYPDPNLRLLTPDAARGGPVRFRLELPDGLRAPEGGLPFRISSTNPHIINMPATASLPEGAQYVDFDIVTTPGSTGINIEIAVGRGTTLTSNAFFLRNSAIAEARGRVLIGGVTPLPNVTVRAGNFTTTTDLSGFFSLFLRFLLETIPSRWNCRRTTNGSTQI